jgi:uncharacterized protein
MSPLDFSLMFALGLVSSLHCVQMCGPIVISYSVTLESLTDPSARPSLITNHFAYNSGRILTYTGLGALAGTAGQSMQLLNRVNGLSHGLAIVSGILMMIVGIAMLDILPARGVAGAALRIPTSILRRAGRLLQKSSAPNRFVLGMLLGFLPCGLIYAALLKAMATGTPASGAATMLAFGLGTAAALIAVGTFSSAIRMRFNRWGSQLAALAITLMGAVLLWRGTIAGMMMEQHMHAHH